MDTLNLFKAAAEGVLFNPQRYNLDMKALEDAINLFISTNGAKEIGVNPVTGVTGSNVQQILSNIATAAAGKADKTYVDGAIQSINLGEEPIYQEFVEDATLSNGIYTYGGLKREDDTLAIDFTLSNLVDGKYMRKIYRFYDAAGTTIIKTVERDLVYKANGSILEVKPSA